MDKPEEVHVMLFYQGCLLNEGKITRDDKHLAKNIKETLRKIDRLKR